MKRDESHIVIGGLPLDEYDRQVRRRIEERERKRLREVCFWFLAVIVFYCAVIVPILANWGLR